MSPLMGERRSRAEAGRFLLLEENRFAQAAVEQLAWGETPLTPRLVFLSGPAGCGKSLLAGLYVRLELAARPDVSTVHVTAAEFGAELAEAAEGKSIPAFQARYRSLDAVVVEDLRALCGRGESLQQLEFVLDAVLARGGRVLLTSRQPPGELPDVPARLVNRFHAGVCARIQLPDYSGRVNLLQHFAEMRGISISYESICAVAKELPVSPRELLAALIQMDHLAAQRGTTLEGETVRGFLAEEIKPAVPTPAEIARAVARCFSTTTRELRGPSRKQSLVVPRQCALYLSRTLTGLSLARIGEYFGGRHHSSVAHACESFGELLENSPQVRQRLVQVRGLLGLGE